MDFHHAVIVGYGSHGRDIHAILQRGAPERDIFTFDEADPAAEDKVEFYRGVPAYLGVNSSTKRREMERRYPVAAPPVVDPSAEVGFGVSMEPGVVVAPGCVILRDVAIGRHTHVNYHASMTRSRIGKFVTICPGVTICGDVTIGDGAFIGAGATVANLVTIGEWATIGAGAVVVADVEPYSVVKGVPAR